MNNNIKGFTITEIMVSVGILSMLLVIGLPTYNQYMRRSKMAEAKVSLSQIFMAQKHFFMQWRFYTHDLLTAGVAPEGELLYNAGLHKSHQFQGTPPSNYPGVIDTSGNNKTFFQICGKQLGTGSVKSCGFVTKKNPINGFANPPSIPQGLAKYDNSSGAFFTAVAIADLKHRQTQNPANTVGKDIWTINNYRQVKHDQDGTK